MHRQIIIILVLLSPLVVNIFSTLSSGEKWGEAFAQVVIRDEIVLEEPNSPDAEFLEMPFYGRVSGGVNWGGIWWGWLKKVVIEAGGQVESRSCTNPCNACYISNSAWVIRDLPKGTMVKVTVYSHCVNGELVEAETRLVNTGTNEYNIEYYHPSHQQWFGATSLKFTATTPPGCDPQFDCIINNFLPEVLLEQRENGYNQIDLCSYGEPGATSPIFDDPNVNTLNIDVCFNKQLQKWWFNLNNNHSLIFSYISIICPENLPPEQEMIEDYTYFPQDWTCEQISDDFACHFAYGAGCAKKVLKNILEKHEEEHIKQIDSLINQIHKIKFYEKLLNINKRCEDFNTLAEAEQFWNKKLSEFFGEFVADLRANYKNMKKTDDFENETHRKIFGFIYSEWDTALKSRNCN